MNLRLTPLRIACLVSASVVCAAAGAANLSAATYEAARDELSSTYKAQRDACDTSSGNAKDICVESAKGQEKVAMAHLQHQRTGSASDMNKLSAARHDARFEIAKEVCDDQTANAKDICLATAKAEHTKAKANAKMKKDVAEARSDAADAKNRADYKVAIERCDALTGKAKDTCTAAARARFGQ